MSKSLKSLNISVIKHISQQTQKKRIPKGVILQSGLQVDYLNRNSVESDEVNFQFGTFFTHFFRPDTSLNFTNMSFA